MRACGPTTRTVPRRPGGADAGDGRRQAGRCSRNPAERGANWGILIFLRFRSIPLSPSNPTMSPRSMTHASPCSRLAASSTFCLKAATYTRSSVHRPQGDLRPRRQHHRPITFIPHGSSSQGSPYSYTRRACSIPSLATHPRLLQDGHARVPPGGPVKTSSPRSFDDRRGTSTSMQLPGRGSTERVDPVSRRSADGDVHHFGEAAIISVYNIARNTFTVFTFTPGQQQVPIWSFAIPRRLRGRAIRHSHACRASHRRDRRRGVADVDSVLSDAGLSFLPTANFLAYTEDRPDTASDLFVMPMDGDREPGLPLWQHRSTAVRIFSPDGRWIASASDRPGNSGLRGGVPGPGRRWQVSNAGGRRPLWTSDGHGSSTAAAVGSCRWRWRRPPPSRRPRAEMVSPAG